MKNFEQLIDQTNNSTSTKDGAPLPTAPKSERGKHPSYSPRHSYFDWMDDAGSFEQTEF